MNRKVFKDVEKHEELIKKGYFKMPLLSKEEVDEILNFVETLQPDDSFKPTNEQISAQSTYHCSFLDSNITYKRRLHDYLISFFKPYTEDILADFEILSINFHIKQPGFGELPIHQNWTTAPIDDTTVTVWCPLVDVSEQNGGLHVIEGSHKIVPDIASLNATIFFRPFEKDLIKNYLKPINMKAGELLVFDDSLIHWSPENNSDKPRIAIQIIMVPKEVTPRYYHYDRKTNLFEEFEITSEFLITHTAQDLVERPEGLISRGFIPNVNKELTLSEFKTKMKQGPITREKIYNGQLRSDSINQRRGLNFLSSIYNRIKNIKVTIKS